MGTSDTFIDIPIFDTYRIQKKVSKYRTSKVSEDQISIGVSVSDTGVEVLEDRVSDTEKSIGCPSLIIRES
jgi:hypothetical protein